MRVGDIMSRDPLYVEEDVFVTKARQMIRDNHVRGLPVLDAGGHVRGIVTTQDMLRVTSTRSNVTVAGFTVAVPTLTEDMDVLDVAKVMLREKATLLPVVGAQENPTLIGVVSLLDIFGSLNLDRVPDRRVSEFMSKKVVTTTPDEPVAKVWDMMLDSDFTGIPVLDGDRTIGMITRFDIIKRGWARLGRDGLSRSRDTGRLKVEKLMSTPLYGIKPDATLREAIEVMLKRDMGRISVIENDKLVGIVDRHDLIKAVIGE